MRRRKKISRIWHFIALRNILLMFLISETMFKTSSFTAFTVWPVFSPCFHHCSGPHLSCRRELIVSIFSVGWSLVEYIVLCHVFWWISYCFLFLLTKQSEEWCCRVLTFVHGCVISFSAIRDILQNKESACFHDAPLSDSQRNYLSFMLSYFLFDFSWFHFFGNEPWVIYFHHITSIMIILRIMAINHGGGGISYAVAGLEITNPYLQLRWFLRTHGYLNTPIHAAVELWFFCLFSLIRTVGGIVLFYYAGIVHQMDLGMKVSFFCIYGISLVLQWQIIAYLKKKYWSGNRGDIGFTNSRVSISQYFQRRTLDRPHQVAPQTENSETVGNSVSTKKAGSAEMSPNEAASVNVQSLLAEEVSESVKDILTHSKKSSAEKSSTVIDESELQENLQ